MIELHKRRIKGVVKIRRVEEASIYVLRTKIIDLLEEEKEKVNNTEQKGEFDFFIQTVISAKAIILAEKIQIYFKEDNYCRKEPEVEISNQRIERLLKKLIPRKPKGV